MTQVQPLVRAMKACFRSQVPCWRTQDWRCRLRLGDCPDYAFTGVVKMQHAYIVHAVRVRERKVLPCNSAWVAVELRHTSVTKMDC